MNAGWDDASWILCGNAPQMAGSEAVWARLGERGEMQIVGIFAEKFFKPGVVGSTVGSEQRGPSGGQFDVPLSVLVAQAFAARAMIGAQPRVRRPRSTVDVERKDIRTDRPAAFVTLIVVHAIKHRGEMKLTEQSKISQHDVNGNPPVGTQWKVVQPVRFQRDQGALGVAQTRNNLGEITRQISFPAKGVDVFRK